MATHTELAVRPASEASSDAEGQPNLSVWMAFSPGRATLTARTSAPISSGSALYALVKAIDDQPGFERGILPLLQPRDV
jgi:hypothetical protein